MRNFRPGSISFEIFVRGFRNSLQNKTHEKQQSTRADSVPVEFRVTPATRETRALPLY